MKTNLYAVYDTASGCYLKTVFARADGEVMREFQNFCTDAKHPFGEHPEDYSLFRLGTGLEVVALSRQIDGNKLAQLDLVEELKKISPGGTA